LPKYSPLTPGSKAVTRVPGPAAVIVAGYRKRHRLAGMERMEAVIAQKQPIPGILQTSNTGGAIVSRNRTRLSTLLRQAPALRFARTV